MKRHSKLLILLLAILTFWVRLPSISEGLPYFYNEDEAHHFNRTVNMVKSGDFNPHYFHKPSLHFYLRMPVVAASFLWNVKEGNIRSLKEIITSDSEGVGGYAFSTSHPGIVKWNRAFSVLLSILTGVLCYLIAFELFEDRLSGPIAFFLSAISPELLRHSGVIGVDVVMTFFCVLTTYASLRCVKSNSRKHFFLCALYAGLAVSSKYNALPIVLVPLLVWGMSPTREVQSGLLILLGVLTGFFGASPYILKELPLFLDQFAYEIWHYKIAGHEGHMGTPGFPQAIFYLQWLRNEALGTLLCIFALIGGATIFVKQGLKGILFLTFPVAFFLLMIEQKANFTRNMIVVLPYLTICAAYLLNLLFSRSKIFGILVLVILVYQPITQTFALREEMRSMPESRIDAEKWLREQPKRDVAASSALEFARSLYSIPGVSREAEELTSVSSFMDGHDTIITNERLTLPQQQLSLIKEFTGNVGLQRIIQNPTIRIWNIEKDKFSRDIFNSFLSSSTARPITFSYDNEKFHCKNDAEDYCWLTQKVSRVYIKDLQRDANFSGRDGLVRMTFTVMNPWEGQKVRFTFDDFLAFIEVPLKQPPGTWETVTVDMPYQELKSEGYFIATLESVHSPLSWGTGVDSRKLGLALKDIRILLR